jgi:competence protein ComEC
VAIREENGDYVLSSRVADRYAAGDWLRRNGQDPAKAEKFPAEGLAPDGKLMCGEGGCRYVKNGRKVAFSFAPQSIKEDCAWADLLIADSPVEGSCRAGLVIDRFDVWREGAYAIWLSDKRYRSVGQDRGERPWTITNRR